ncbi:hypothetical protein J1614_003659 [Plenodomus biglobosus]|nr:hypothetical protein J1614_003659 [Plenodomus biglobosus]
MSVPTPKDFNQYQITVENASQNHPSAGVREKFEHFNSISQSHNHPDENCTAMTYSLQSEHDSRCLQEASHNRLTGGSLLYEELLQKDQSTQYFKETATQERSHISRFTEYARTQTSTAYLSTNANKAVSKGLQHLASPQIPSPNLQYASWASTAPNPHAAPPTPAPDFSRGGGNDTPNTIDASPSITPRTPPVQRKKVTFLLPPTPQRDTETGTKSVDVDEVQRKYKCKREN